jgi:hypothetical protein
MPDRWRSEMTNIAPRDVQQAASLLSLLPKTRSRSQQQAGSLLYIC